jgi:NitT/TauT family transport system substrate-binding protein
VIADPAMGAEAVVARSPAADPGLEERRLQLAIDANVATPFALENGIGGIDEDRMARAIEQTRLVYEFQNEPDPSLYFDPQYLPDAAERMLQ